MLTNWKTLLVFTFATLAFTTNSVIGRERDAHGNPLSALDSSLEGLNKAFEETIGGVKRGHKQPPQPQQQHRSGGGGGGSGNPLGVIQKTLNSDLKFLENSLQSLLKSLKKRDIDGNDDQEIQFEERDLVDSLAKLLNTNNLYDSFTNHAQKRSPVLFTISPSVFGDTNQAPALDVNHILDKREPLGGGKGGSPLSAITDLLGELTSALKKREPEPLGGGSGNPLAAIEGLLSELTSALKKREPEPLGGGKGGSPLSAVTDLLGELTSALKKREPEPLGSSGGGSPLDAITNLLSELTSALKKRDGLSSEGSSNNDDSKNDQYDNDVDQYDTKEDQKLDDDNFGSKQEKQPENDNYQQDSKQEQKPQPQPSQNDLTNKSDSKQDQDSFDGEMDFKKEEEEMKMKFGENNGNQDGQKSSFGSRMIKRMVRDI